MPARFTGQQDSPFSPVRSIAGQAGVTFPCLFHCWDAGISGKLNSFSQGKELESLSEMVKWQLRQWWQGLEVRPPMTLESVGRGGEWGAWARRVGRVTRQTIAHPKQAKSG